MCSDRKISVFLAGIMQGSISAKQIHTQSWRDEITALLAKYMPQAEIYCHYSANRNSLEYDSRSILKTFESGTRMAAKSELVICWLPQASMGTAVEMYLAYKAGQTVVSVTPMAINWVVKICSDFIVEDFDGLEKLLASGELAETLALKANPQQAKMPGGKTGKNLPEIDEFWQDGNE